jgi:hypothetical protein
METDLSIAQGCLIQSTTDPNLVLVAALALDGRDDDPSNDQATLRIDIEPAITVTQ